MTTATIKLYEILVEKGVDKDVAREAVGEFISREEAMSVLATKADLQRVIMWTAGLLIGQIAINTGIMFALFQVYSG